MHERVQEIHKNPGSKTAECLVVQMQLLEKVIYLEQRIRECRKRIKELNRELGQKNHSPVKALDSRLLKTQVAQIHRTIHEYRGLIWTFKNLADGLAFTYLNRWDIKPITFHQGSGFLSGKSGLKAELMLLRRVFRDGEVALLNDLTNCLNTGDICIASDGVPYLFEVKSKPSHTPRTERQRSRMRFLEQYFDEDKAEGLYGTRHEVSRFAIHSPEVDRIYDLNRIIEAARTAQAGYCFEEVEDGLYYGATYSNDDHIVDTLVARHGPGKLIVSMANAWKRQVVGYYRSRCLSEIPRLGSIFAAAK